MSISLQNLFSSKAAHRVLAVLATGIGGAVGAWVCQEAIVSNATSTPPAVAALGFVVGGLIGFLVTCTSCEL